MEGGHLQKKKKKKGDEEYRGEYALVWARKTVPMRKPPKFSEAHHTGIGEKWIMWGWGGGGGSSIGVVRKTGPPKNMWLGFKWLLKEEERY